ncbi:MAG: cyclic nucleotide-binding domain-containing protein [Rhodocyclaceae bacterium]|nr:MAG: cyclic nucleotide-binding domain-containing protein [Rhodocyclaceae bacterium]
MLFFDLFRNDPKFTEVKAGQTLFREGDAGEVMYVLIRGEAEVTIDGMLVETCEPGTILGEMAVIDGSPRSATVTALTDCEFAIVDKKRFLFLVNETPKFAIFVMQVMAQRLKACDLRLLEAKAGNSRQDTAQTG